MSRLKHFLSKGYRTESLRVRDFIASENGQLGSKHDANTGIGELFEMVVFLAQTHAVHAYGVRVGSRYVVAISVVRNGTVFSSSFRYQIL